MRLPTVEQFIRDTNMFIYFDVIHWQSLVSWMVEEFVRLSEELYLMYTFVQTTVNDINKTKVKNHWEKPRYPRQINIWNPHSINRWGYFMGHYPIFK